MITRIAMRQRIAVEVGVTILIAGILFGMPLLLRKDMHDAISELRRKEALLQLHEYYALHAPSLQTSLPKARSLFTEFDKALLPSENIRDFTDIIQSHATRNNVITTLTTSDPLPTKYSWNEGKLMSIRVELEVAGSPHSVQAYLGDIERLPYFFNFETYKESRTIDSSTSTSITVEGMLWTKPTQQITKHSQ